MFFKPKLSTAGVARAAEQARQTERERQLTRAVMLSIESLTGHAPRPQRPDLWAFLCVVGWLLGISAAVAGVILFAKTALAAAGV